MRKRLVIAVIVLAALILLAVVVVRLFFPAEKVRRLIADRAGAAIGLEVRLGEVRPSLFPAGVEVEGVTIENPVAGAPPLLELREAGLAIRLLPLLSRRIELSRISARDATITIVKEPPGSDDSPARTSPGGEGEGGSSFALLLPSVTLRNGKVRWIDGERGEEYLFDRIDGSTSIEAAAGGGPLVAEGDLKVGRIVLPPLGEEDIGDQIGGLRVRYEIDYRPAEGSARIGLLRLGFGDLELALTGELAGLPDRPEGSFRIARTDLDLGEVLSILPTAAVPAAEEIEGSGPFTLEGEVSIVPEQAPSIRFLLSLGGLRIGYGDLSGLVRELRGEIEATGDRLVARDLRFDLIGSPATLSVEAADPFGSPDLSFDLRAGKIDCNALLPGRGGGATTGGAAGSGGRPAPDPLPSIVLPPLPPVDLAGTVRAETLITGESELFGVDVRITVEGTEGDAVLRVESGSFGGVRVREGRGDFEISGGSVSGSFSAAAAVAYRIPFRSLRGEIVLDPVAGLVRLDQIRARVYEGFVEGSAEVLLGQGGEYSFTARAESLEANDFLTSLTPVRDVFFGRFRIESSWEGRGFTEEELLRSLSAEGTMGAADGEIRNLDILDRIGRLLGIQQMKEIRFRDLWSDFAVSGGRVRFDRLEIASTDADWIVSGSVGFDGSLDYDVTAVLSENVSARYREKSSLAGLFQNEEGRVVLDFLVTGTAESPRITLDVAKTASRSGVRDLDDLIESIGGEEKVQEAIEDLLKGKNPLKNLLK